MGEILHSFVDTVVNSPYALWGLAVIAFAESSFFPIPPDAIMIPLALLNPGFALVYALVSTVSSVLGGILGYLIGDKGGKRIVYKFVSEEKLYTVKLFYAKYDVWAIVIAGFTPIPYKVFTVAAGLFDINFKRFVMASVIGRGGRFFLVGTAIFIFGPSIRTFLDQYLELTIIGFTVLLIGGFFFMNKVLKKAVEPKPENTP